MNIFDKAIEGIKKIFKSGKTALGTALIIAGGIFLVSMIVQILPTGLGLIGSLLVGVVIIILGGYLLATDK